MNNLRRKLGKTERMILRCCGILLALGALTIAGCPIRKLFGVPCPGCGLTRAWMSFLTGQWKSALQYHPLFLAAPIALIIAAHGDACLKGRLGRVRMLLLIFISLLFLGCYLYRVPLLCA